MCVDIVLVRDRRKFDELHLQGEATVARSGKAQTTTYRFEGWQRLKGLLTQLIGPARRWDGDG